MAIATVPYGVQIDHDGTKYLVNIPALDVPKCTDCGTISIDDYASEQIDKAFRQEAKLLTADEIRSGRKMLGLRQQDFAKILGIGVSTLSRWESGTQVQQHFHDGILRAFFAHPEMQAYLADLHGVAFRPSVTNTVFIQLEDQATSWQEAACSSMIRRQFQTLTPREMTTSDQPSWLLTAL